MAGRGRKGDARIRRHLRVHVAPLPNKVAEMKEAPSLLTVPTSVPNHLAGLEIGSKTRLNGLYRPAVITTHSPSLHLDSYATCFGSLGLMKISPRGTTFQRSKSTWHDRGQQRRNGTKVISLRYYGRFRICKALRSHHHYC